VVGGPIDHQPQWWHQARSSQDFQRGGMFIGDLDSTNTGWTKEDGDNAVIAGQARHRARTAVNQHAVHARSTV
jgi:hypothetical protein